MLVETLSEHTGFSTREVTRLMALSPAELGEDPAYLEAVHYLDRNLLFETLPKARERLDTYLPALSREVTNRYNINGSVMSSYTLANWIVSFLDYPDQVSQLAEIHSHLPADLFERYLPELLNVYREVPYYGTLWQRAMCLLTIALVAKG